MPPLVDVNLRGDSDRRLLLQGLIHDAEVEPDGIQAARSDQAGQQDSSSGRDQGKPEQDVDSKAHASDASKLALAEEGNPVSDDSAHSDICDAISRRDAPASAPTPSAGFPFFPFMMADSSCLSPACSLTQTLCLEDESVSLSLLDACLDHMVELVNANPQRVWLGIAVYHQPMQMADSQHGISGSSSSAAAAPSQSSLCRVSDFVTVFGVFCTLLSLSDSLTSTRVEAGLSRLFALVRRVAARRHSATTVTSASSSSSSTSGLSNSSINGTEERFLLVAIRSLLRLSVTQRAVAVWLRSHEREWQAWEQLYTTARHLMPHHVR
jgi:hypothetical protein